MLLVPDVVMFGLLSYVIRITKAMDGHGARKRKMTSSQLFLGMCILGVIALPVMVIYALVAALFGDDEPINALRGKPEKEYEPETEEEEK